MMRGRGFKMKKPVVFDSQSLIDVCMFCVNLKLR